MADDALLLFLKAPRPGRVKTRLAASIGDEAAAALYKSFVEDLLQAVSQGPWNIAICYDPPQAQAEISAWLAPIIGRDFEMIPQKGADLGERMANAFKTAFQKEAQRAVLMGTDFPDLPREFVSEAFAALRKRSGAIGPAADGGYYLIGFQKEGFTEHIFKEIPWSTDRVYEETLSRFREKNLSFGLVPAWRDLDNETDMEDFISRWTGAENPKSGAVQPVHPVHTLKTIEAIFRKRPKKWTGWTG